MPRGCVKGYRPVMVMLSEQVWHRLNAAADREKHSAEYQARLIIEQALDRPTIKEETAAEVVRAAGDVLDTAIQVGEGKLPLLVVAKMLKLDLALRRVKEEVK